MDTMAAFLMGEANRNKEQKVFDWNKAAKLIVEHNAVEADAGLAEDFNWTGGTIFHEGKPTNKDDSYCYLASTWATPIIKIDGEEIECWLMKTQTPGWDCDTFWPESALAILNEKKA